MSQLGFIGLGIMGSPMAQHLVKAGHTVHVTTRSKVPPALIEAGAIACANAREVAAKADTIVTIPVGNWTNNVVDVAGASLAFSADFDAVVTTA